MNFTKTSFTLMHTSDDGRKADSIAIVVVKLVKSGAEK
jgi:hypothetical protein